jgi:flagellar basal-body rod protein FlgB
MADLNKIQFSGADAFLRAAMSGLAARQRTIAHNVANVDTPNFKASEVRFEDTLKAAMTRAARGLPNAALTSQTALNAAASQARLVDATSTRGDGNNVDIDREMEVLSESNLTYSALTQAMSTRISILRNVIGGGR